jgi:hypothetical protein
MLPPITCTYRSARLGSLVLALVPALSCGVSSPASTLECRASEDPVALAEEESKLWRLVPRSEEIQWIREQPPRLRFKIRAAGTKHRIYISKACAYQGSTPFDVQFSFELNGWKSIDTVSVGWRAGDRFWLERLKHVENGVLNQVEVRPGSVAFGLANDWLEPETWAVDQLRIVVVGTPGATARLDLLGASLLTKSSTEETYRLRLGDRFVSEDRFEEWYARIRGRGKNAKFSNAWSAFSSPRRRHALANAEALRNRGEYRLTSLPPIEGKDSLSVPGEIADFTTSRYRWLSLDIVRTLLDAYDQSEEAEYLYLARDHVRDWMKDHHGGVQGDEKYMWYDHGTAMRLISLLRFWEYGAENGFSMLFMRDLLRTIVTHARLLAAPSFYSRNQPELYHNHGIFQDISLLAAGLVIPELEDAEGWRTLASSRLLNQFHHLVSKEGVWVENTSAYHFGAVRICRLSEELLSGPETEVQGESLPELCAAMDRFSGRLRNPDGTVSAFGDGWRLSNATRSNFPATYRKPAEDFIYPESGFVILAGAEDQDAQLPRWQLTAINSSLSITHKHADNLSFTLWADGIEWMIDPGFHSYSDSPHGLYARRAEAHNAVVLSGLSYEPRVGMGRVVTSEILENGAVVALEHTGYKNILMRRRFATRKDQGIVFLQDEVERAFGAPSVPAETWFHLGDGVVGEWSAASKVLQLHHPDRTTRVAVVFDWEADCQSFSGQLESVMAGWFYPAFGQARETESWRCVNSAARGTSEQRGEGIVFNPQRYASDEDLRREALRSQ